MSGINKFIIFENGDCDAQNRSKATLFIVTNISGELIDGDKKLLISTLHETFPHAKARDIKFKKLKKSCFGFSASRHILVWSGLVERKSYKPLWLRIKKRSQQGVCLMCSARVLFKLQNRLSPVKT